MFWENFFTGETRGTPLEMFGPVHGIFLLVILALNLSIILFGSRFTEKTKKWFPYLLTGILLANEASYHIWAISLGRWTIQEMLPLHVCAVLIWLSPLMLIKKNRTVFEVTYLLGIATAFMVILTPALDPFGFPHFRWFHVFTSHGMLILAAVYMVFVEKFRPHPKSLLKTFGIINLYMIPVGLVNFLVGGNYVFLAHKPSGTSVLDLFGPWPWYILGMEFIGMTLALLLYLPFAVKDWKERRRAKKKAREIFRKKEDEEKTVYKLLA